MSQGWALWTLGSKGQGQIWNLNFVAAGGICPVRTALVFLAYQLKFIVNPRHLTLSTHLVCMTLRCQAVLLHNVAKLEVVHAPG